MVADAVVPLLVAHQATPIVNSAGGYESMSRLQLVKACRAKGIAYANDDYTSAGTDAGKKDVLRALLVGAEKTPTAPVAASVEPPPHANNAPAETYVARPFTCTRGRCPCMHTAGHIALPCEHRGAPRRCSPQSAVV